MSRICDLSGKRTRFGNHVSHANNKTRRKFLPNLHKKRFLIPSTGQWIQLSVSSSVLRSINRVGIEKVIRNHGKEKLLQPK